MRMAFVWTGIILGVAGCSVDAPDSDQSGTFACKDGGDCIDGFICDDATKTCIRKSVQSGCSGTGCDTCGPRGSICRTNAGATGICARVRLTSGLALTCAPCPTTCSSSCLEVSLEDKLIALATKCSGTQRSCTDTDCSCTQSTDCAPSLVCRANTCQNPCLPWPACSSNQACVADASISSFRCIDDCGTSYASCFTSVDGGATRTCMATLKRCVNPAVSVVQVLWTRPTPDSYVAAGKTVQIGFTMPLLMSTVSDATFYVEGPSGVLPGNRNLIDESTVEFQPTTTPFTSGNTYRVHILKGITCTANMPLDRETTFAFTVL
jgi:hypothetical protein